MVTRSGKLRTTITTGALATGLLFALTACGSSPARTLNTAIPHGTDRPTSTGGIGTMVKGPLPTNSGQQMAQLSEPLFPLVLAAADPSPANPSYSPVSVYLALALTGNGARGNTASQFEQLLGGGIEQINEIATGMMTEYVTAADGPTLSVANSIWLNTGFELDPAFFETARSVFRTEPTVLDLQAEGKDKINAWVYDKTNHLIQQIVDRVTPDAVAFLVNALYFKGAWVTPFDEAATTDEPFALLDGSTVQAPTMVASDLALPYFKSDSGEGLVLPYEGGRFAMLLVMPAGGPGNVAWDGQAIASWLTAAQERDGVELHLPKWESETSAKLAGPLMDLGLIDAFTDAADLTGLGQAAPDAPLVISEVAHKAVVKVDEAGTEAAAATSVGVRAGAALPGAEPVVVRFDKPYVFAIVDLDSGVPLFLGQVTNPTA
ncbi:MAG: serpin family protein [Micrococcales bacterium]|nr:serpin family protein [Micrococcales bacterium]